MTHRTLTSAIHELLRYYPIVSVSGPRQSGKTTLLRHLFPDLPYISLEDPDQRRFASDDPRRFLETFPNGAILDEVQLLPHLFSYLQTKVDLQPTLKFILSGSQNFLLMEHISQSLAGRVGILKLLPFSLSELPVPELDTWLWQGGYPTLYDRQTPPRIYFPNYLQTYLERDVRTLKNVGNLVDFERFMRLCAGRAGQLLNISSLANDTGISANTAKSWLSVLEASYVLYQLPPFYQNFNKRVIKQTKLYFYDTGLLAYLLQIEKPEQASNHFAIGALFENAVISEMLKQWFNRGEKPQFYFFRDSNGNEVDLVIPKGNTYFAIELKYGKTINSHFFKGLDTWSAMSGTPPEQQFLIYGGDENSMRSQAKVVSWKAIAEVASTIFG